MANAVASTIVVLSSMLLLSEYDREVIVVMDVSPTILVMLELDEMKLDRAKDVSVAALDTVLKRLWRPFLSNEAEVIENGVREV